MFNIPISMFGWMLTSHPQTPDKYRGINYKQSWPNLDTNWCNMLANWNITNYSCSTWTNIPFLIHCEVSMKTLHKHEQLEEDVCSPESWYPCLMLLRIWMKRSPIIHKAISHDMTSWAGEQPSPYWLYQPQRSIELWKWYQSLCWHIICIITV